MSNSELKNDVDFSKLHLFIISSLIFELSKEVKSLNLQLRNSSLDCSIFLRLLKVLLSEKVQVLKFTLQISEIENSNSLKLQL